MGGRVDRWTLSEDRDSSLFAPFVLPASVIGSCILALYCYLGTAVLKGQPYKHFHC